MTRLLVDPDVILEVLMKRQPHVLASAMQFLLIQAGEFEAHASAVTFVRLHDRLRKTLGH